MNGAEELLCKTFNLDTFDYHSIRIMREVYETAIDIALQELAKEIKKDLETFGVNDWTENGDRLISYREWEEFWEKYGGKEK